LVVVDPDGLAVGVFPDKAYPTSDPFVVSIEFGFHGFLSVDSIAFQS
jgi:hypothetical protein